MPLTDSMKINNIKLSLRFEKPFFARRVSQEKITKIIHSATCVFYAHSPQLCNLTGVKSREVVTRVIQALEAINDNKCLETSIDSVMATQRAAHGIRLEQVKAKLPSVTPLYKTDFEAEVSAGTFLFFLGCRIIVYSLFPYCSMLFETAQWQSTFPHDSFAPHRHNPVDGGSNL